MYLCIYIYICTYVYMYVCVCIYIHTYVYVYVYIYIYIYFVYVGSDEMHHGVVVLSKTAQSITRSQTRHEHREEQAQP